MTSARRIRADEPEPTQRELDGGSSERVTGIEPAFSAWEADVLPLNYTRAGE